SDAVLAPCPHAGSAIRSAKAQRGYQCQRRGGSLGFPAFWALFQAVSHPLRRVAFRNPPPLAQNAVKIGLRVTYCTSLDEPAAWSRFLPGSSGLGVCGEEGPNQVRGG